MKKSLSLIINSNSSENDKLLFKCKVLEISEQFEDLIEQIKSICIENKRFLNAEEKHFLSVAYKSTSSSIRNSLVCLNRLRKKYDCEKAIENCKIIDKNIDQLQSKLKDICFDVFNLIDNHILCDEIIKNLNFIEEVTAQKYLIFFYKMYGDYSRYLAEYSNGDERIFFITKSKDSYIRGKKIAEEAEKINQADSTYLGLLLNYSVLLYEVDGKREEAIEVSKSAFENALKSINCIGESEYDDTKLLLQYLKNNTTLWISQSELQSKEDK